MPGIGRRDPDARCHRPVPAVAHDKLAVACAARFHGDLTGGAEIEIPVSGRGTVDHVADVLVGIVLAVLTLLGEGRMVFILLVRKAFGCAVFAEQMARNARFVAALILQGTAVETAGGDLRLMEPFAVKHDLLGTGLAGEEVAVGLSVIEDIPFPAHTPISALDTSTPPK